MRNLLILLLLCSCTKITTDANPSTSAPFESDNVVVTRFITSDDFRGSKMRGFDLSIVQNLAELKAKNIAGARATGANVGRYWIRVSHDANNVYSFTNSATLTTLDSAVRIAEKVGIYLIVTLEVLPNQGKCDLWGNTTRKNGVKKIWQQLATRYKSKKIIAAYDLINEPRINTTTHAGSIKEYIDWQIEVIKAIRLIDPMHTIAVEVLGNSMLADAYMSAITPMKNLIYSPHGYSPLILTHQGMNAYTGSTATQSRAKFPTSLYPSTYFSATTSAYWTTPRNFQLKYNVPIWIGEFSFVNWSPKNDLGEWSSTRWVDDCIRKMESYGWSWSYHAWNEFQGWDPMIPSSYYTQFTFKNAAPFTSSTRPSGWSNQRSTTAPTITVLKKWFSRNL